MMDLQSRGPQFNFPSDRWIDSRCRQSLVQILDHACTRVSMGLTDRRKTAKNLVGSRKN